MDRDIVIDAIKNLIEGIEYAISMTEGVIDGTPWIVECCEGLYLVAESDGFVGGSVTGAVVCYAPDQIDQVVEHVRDNSRGIFDNARKVLRRDALRSELARHVEILNRLNAKAEA